MSADPAAFETLTPGQQRVISALRTQEDRLIADWAGPHDCPACGSIPFPDGLPRAERIRRGMKVREYHRTALALAEAQDRERLRRDRLGIAPRPIKRAKREEAPSGRPEP